MCRVMPLIRFNSRSREGSDASTATPTSLSMSFNSRSREGSDSVLFGREFARGVSIRAPARGATGAGIGINAGRCVSIRAPARGATNAAYAPIAERLFQFALPRGERR